MQSSVHDFLFLLIFLLYARYTVLTLQFPISSFSSCISLVVLLYPAVIVVPMD